MEKKRIGVDLDDVLLDFNTSLAFFHNEKYGTSYTRDEIVSFDLGHTWNVPPAEVRRRVFEFFESDTHAHANPVPGAQVAIAKIAEMHEIFIVTAKSDALAEITNRWLLEHYGDVFAGVHFTNQFQGTAVKTKADVCEELGVALFVDDHIGNLHEIAEKNIATYLFDTPWNRHEATPPHIERVHSWDEVLEKLAL